MSKGITQQEYWREVKSVAKSIKSETREKGSTKDEWLDRAREQVHAAVDGHSWIIYTWANPYVLIHSSNSDALFEQGAGQSFDSYSDAMVKMAFYAFYEDVGAALEDLFS